MSEVSESSRVESGPRDEVGGWLVELAVKREVACDGRQWYYKDTEKTRVVSEQCNAWKMQSGRKV